MRDIGVGVIGTGFMGKAHCFAYRAVAGIFPGSLRPVLQSVADINGQAAEQATQQFGFLRWRTDWRTLAEDPNIEIVSITTPNVVHREMVLAAIAAGKHVHCEKPIAPNADAARDMMDAPEAAGVVTQVGCNYIKNPMLKLARSMVAAGELGEITGFRGIHAEDYMEDPEIPYNWRVDASGGAGAIADIGSHVVGMARFLLGPVSHVNADLETVVKSRPTAAGSSERRAVEVDDIARLTVRFEPGCEGAIEANWVATERKMQLGFELTGVKGSLVYTQERLNELLHYRVGGDPRHGGYIVSRQDPRIIPTGCSASRRDTSLASTISRRSKLPNSWKLSLGREARAGFSRSLGNSEGHRYRGPIIQNADVASNRVSAAIVAARGNPGYDEIVERKAAARAA